MSDTKYLTAHSPSLFSCANFVAKVAKHSPRLLNTVFYNHKKNGTLILHVEFPVTSAGLLFSNSMQSI